MTQDFNDKNAVYNLLRLVREQNDAIHELRLLLGALTWLVTRGDEEKTRELNGMIWMIDHARPNRRWRLTRRIGLRKHVLMRFTKPKTQDCEG